jgi:hypothetical protein
MPMRLQIMSSRSIKNGMAAFLLGVLTPGLGQIFNGQLWKGVLSYGGLLGFFLVSTAIGLIHSFKGIAIYLILSLSAYVFVLGEAVFTAVRQAHGSSTSSYMAFLCGGPHSAFDSPLRRAS